MTTPPAAVGRGLRAKEPRPWANYTRERPMAVHSPSGEVIEQMLAWRRGRLLVTSSVDEMEFHGELRWQWLLAISAGGWRATDEECARVLRDFDMEGAEEDNHFPGRVRSFFRLCDTRPGDPSQCECKETEETVVEPDGFRWQRERGQEDKR